MRSLAFVRKDNPPSREKAANGRASSFGAWNAGSSVASTSVLHAASLLHSWCVVMAGSFPHTCSRLWQSQSSSCWSSLSTSSWLRSCGPGDWMLPHMQSTLPWLSQSSFCTYAAQQLTQQTQECLEISPYPSMMRRAPSPRLQQQ